MQFIEKGENNRVTVSFLNEFLIISYRQSFDFLYKLTILTLHLNYGSRLYKNEKIPGAVSFVNVPTQK